MITFFTTAKPFLGTTGLQQVNAIRSWRAVHPQAEVLLLGEGSGYREAAAALHIRHIPEVQTNPAGTPLISDLFAKADALASNRLLAFVNCDIIFMDDLWDAVRTIPMDRFLLAGQRWDLGLDAEIDFSCDWRTALRQRLAQYGRPHAPAGSDYFVFQRGTLGDLPPLTVGRAGWDNWLLRHCLAANMPVIDASMRIKPAHQNHVPYAAHPAAAGKDVLSEECENLSFLSSGRRLTLVHADWYLAREGPIRKKSLRHRMLAYSIRPLLRGDLSKLERAIGWLAAFLLVRADRHLGGRVWLPQDVPHAG